MPQSILHVRSFASQHECSFLKRRARHCRLVANAMSQFQWARFSAEVEGEEDPVHGRLPQPEPVGVAGAPAVKTTYAKGSPVSTMAPSRSRCVHVPQIVQTPRRTLLSYVYTCSPLHYISSSAVQFSSTLILMTQVIPTNPTEAWLQHANCGSGNFSAKGIDRSGVFVNFSEHFNYVYLFEGNV
jgi:hypothetical protein